MGKPIDQRTHKKRRENDSTRGPRVAVHARREERREEAKDRQEARARRTTAEQIARLDDAPGLSTRERARLAS